MYNTTLVWPRRSAISLAMGLLRLRLREAIRHFDIDWAQTPDDRRPQPVLQSGGGLLRLHILRDPIPTISIWAQTPDVPPSTVPQSAATQQADAGLGHHCRRPSMSLPSTPTTPITPISIPVRTRAISSLSKVCPCSLSRCQRSAFEDGPIAARRPVPSRRPSRVANFRFVN